MTQREWYVDMTTNLNHICEADDDDRKLIVLYLRMLVESRALGRRNGSDCAMNAATELVKRVCRKKLEAGS